MDEMDEHENVDDYPFDDPTGEFPPSLVKALQDPFDYALGLCNGQVIHFAEAQIVKGGKWVKLIGSELGNRGADYGDIEMEGVSFRFPRGLDVRISEIAWVADAPNGS